MPTNYDTNAVLKGGKWYKSDGVTPEPDGFEPNYDQIRQMSGDRHTFSDMVGVTHSQPPTTTQQVSTPTAGQFDPAAIYNDTYNSDQQTALDALQREVQFGGMTPEEKTAYQRQSAQSAGIAAGQRAGLAQQMIAKGMPASIANQMSGEIGQQQESQTGYLMGTAANQMANQRAYDAANAMSGLASNMQSQGLNESEFNAGQGQRGVLEEYQALTGQAADTLSRADALQAQNAQNTTTAINGGLGLASTLAKMSRNNNSGGGGGGSSGGGGYSAPDWGTADTADTSMSDTGADWGS